MKQLELADVYRKVRNTARCLLGNLHDFDPRPAEEGGDAIAYSDLPPLDQWMLQRTAAPIETVRGDFECSEFYRFFQALANFCVVDLSNAYLDIAKERLYLRGAGEFRRCSCQTVLCHVDEDIWQNLPYPVAKASVFQRGWPTAPAAWHQLHLQAPMAAILKLRALVNHQLESCRKRGGKGNSAPSQRPWNGWGTHPMPE